MVSKEWRRWVNRFRRGCRLPLCHVFSCALLHALFIRKASSSLTPERIPRDRPIPEGTEQPSYGKRILAMLLDLLLPCAFLGLAFFTKGDARLGLVLASAGVYFILMVALPRTPGQLVFGLSVVNRLGKRASILRRFARAICLPIPLVSMVGVFRPLASSSCQSVHDMVAGRHVRHSNSAAPGRLLSQDS